MIGMMEDNFVAQEFLQLLDGSGGEALLVMELETVMFPLGGEESVYVVGQSGRESMMSKPFDQALAKRVEIAMFGGKESAVHVGVQELTEVNWKL